MDTRNHSPIGTLNYDVLLKIFCQLPLSDLKTCLLISWSFSEITQKIIKEPSQFSEKFSQENLGNEILLAIQNPAMAKNIFSLIQNALGDKLKISFEKPENKYQAWLVIFHALTAKYFPFNPGKNISRIISTQAFVTPEMDITDCMLHIYPSISQQENDLLLKSLFITKWTRAEMFQAKLYSKSSTELYYNLSGLRENAKKIPFINLNKILHFSSDNVCKGLNIYNVVFNFFRIDDADVEYGDPLKNIQFFSISKTDRDEEGIEFYLPNSTINNQAWFACLYARRHYLRIHDMEKANLILDLMQQIENKIDQSCGQTMQAWFGTKLPGESKTNLEKLNTHRSEKKKMILEHSVVKNIFGLFGQPTLTQTHAAQFFLILHEKASEREVSPERENLLVL